jgi:hypothetical protein
MGQRLISAPVHFGNRVIVNRFILEEESSTHIDGSIEIYRPDERATDVKLNYSTVT